jgi:hypothetical protein
MVTPLGWTFIAVALCVAYVTALLWELIKWCMWPLISPH